MIEVSQLSYFADNKSILDGISLKIETSKITGIIGKNGAGKSTLIKCLAGLHQIKKSQILFNGKDLTSMSVQNLSKKRVVLSQEIPISFGMSVFDILLMGRFPFHPLDKDDFEYVDYIIHELELLPLLNTPYTSLSGGERQRVHFGRAMCQLMPFTDLTQKVLFLDEPLAALDLSIQQKVLKYLKILQDKQGLTIVLILHDLNWIAQYCDEVVLLESGKLINNGTPNTTFTKTNLKKFFNVETSIINNENNRPTIIYL